MRVNSLCSFLCFSTDWWSGPEFSLICADMPSVTCLDFPQPLADLLSKGTFWKFHDKQTSCSKTAAENPLQLTKSTTNLIFFRISKFRNSKLHCQKFDLDIFVIGLSFHFFKVWHACAWHSISKGNIKYFYYVFLLDS